LPALLPESSPAAPKDAFSITMRNHQSNKKAILNSGNPIGGRLAVEHTDLT
jgi:hypothetical protein